MKLNVLVPVVLGVMFTVDASAIPFYGNRARSGQAQPQAEGEIPGLMTNYTRDAATGLADFAFLARNFSGSNPGNGGNRPGAIGPELPIVDGGDTPASAPGTMALLAVGAAVLTWRRRWLPRP